MFIMGTSGRDTTFHERVPTGRRVMKDTELKALEPLMNAAEQAAEGWLDSPAAAELKRALQEASAKLPPGMSLTFDCVLHVFDANRERQVRLLETGITTSGGDSPYRCAGDSTMQRYLAGGEICELPHDHCPVCWGIWDFKDRHRTCPTCGVTLGEDVRFLLDSDVCPHCEKGHVTADSPACEQCGYEVDPSTVSWG